MASSISYLGLILLRRLLPRRQPAERGLEALGRPGRKAVGRLGLLRRAGYRVVGATAEPVIGTNSATGVTGDVFIRARIMTSCVPCGKPTNMYCLWRADTQPRVVTIASVSAGAVRSCFALHGSLSMFACDICRGLLGRVLRIADGSSGWGMMM